MHLFNLSGIGFGGWGRRSSPGPGGAEAPSHKGALPTTATSGDTPTNPRTWSPRALARRIVVALTPPRTAGQPRIDQNFECQAHPRLLEQFKCESEKSMKAPHAPQQQEVIRSGGQVSRLKVHPALVPDIERNPYVIGTMHAGAKEYNLNRSSKPHTPERARQVAHVLGHLRDELGSDELVAQVSRLAHQNGVAALSQALVAPAATPFSMPDGSPAFLVGTIRQSTRYQIERVRDGVARICVNYEEIPHQLMAAQAFRLSPVRSRAAYSFSWLVHKSGRVEVEAGIRTNCRVVAMSRFESLMDELSIGPEMIDGRWDYPRGDTLAERFRSKPRTRADLEDVARTIGAIERSASRWSRMRDANGELARLATLRQCVQAALQDAPAIST